MAPKQFITLLLLWANWAKPVITKKSDDVSSKEGRFVQNCGKESRSGKSSAYLFLIFLSGGAPYNFFQLIQNKV